MQEKPVWLDEQPEILQLLHQFLDKLDVKPAEQRRLPPAISINAQTIPGLFKLDEQADHMWALLLSLSHSNSKVLPLLEIRLNKKRNPLDPDYYQARLRLNLEAEPVLRHWLKRPKQIASLVLWQQAVDEIAGKISGESERLRHREIKFSGKTPQQVVDAFCNIQQFQQAALSLRQISARCFWGDSKFLDNREDLVRALHSNLQIAVRPLLVNVHVPAEINAILFIENQDTYTHAISSESSSLKTMALVYCAGFKGSASRIRSREGVSLHYHSQNQAKLAHHLENWWFENDDANWPVYFWGDLDFAGMSILKALRQRFATIQTWQPGYEAMLSQLQNNEGHFKHADEKLTQQDPGQTGCQYADSILLPAIRTHRRFVDQEMVQL